jgi:hypothetical protein
MSRPGLFVEKDFLIGRMTRGEEKNKKKKKI